MVKIDELRSYQDTPDTFILLCLKTIINKPMYLNRYTLPPELGHLIVETFRKHALAARLSSTDCIRFFKHFRHKNIPLTSINFSDLPIVSSFFIDFLLEYKDQLDEINISKCRSLSSLNIRKINELLKKGKQGVKTLIIGDTLSVMIGRTLDTYHEKLLDNDLELKKLVLHGIHSSLVLEESTIERRLSQILTPTMSYSLKFLDLSRSLIGKGTALMQLHSLEILILYNCTMQFPDIVSTVCQLKRLRMLDISREAIEPDESTPVADNSNLLDLLVSSIPNLSRLDISGTNLVGGKDRNISAFETRLDKPFEFLGLFHTSNDAAYRSCIPAQIVAGEATESQMLNACEAYMDRPEQLSKALDDLNNFYKTITPSDTTSDVYRALDILLPTLIKYINDEQIIMPATSSLYHIVKLSVTTRSVIDAKTRRTITSRLLDAMLYNKSSKVILINGSLAMLFLPDIICEYARVTAISLMMCRDLGQGLQGFGTTLLNTLACKVGGAQKIFMGQLSAIEAMLDIIWVKIEENSNDEILEIAWSTLWNITDETPVNCKMFLDYGGFNYFEKCMDKFANNKEVLRNMMGLLGNVAECKELRYHFMKKSYIERFYILLSSQSDGIECSYNACGILAHIVSDGQEFWNNYLQNQVDRNTLLRGMRNAISKWPINSPRNINYRSFEPIVRLLDINIDAEAQHWAVFAITNLTRTNPTNYCPMLLPHDGLSKLRLLSQPGLTEPHVQNLAMIAIYQYERFVTLGTLSGLEQCDSIDRSVIWKFQAESDPADGTSDMGELL